VQFINNLVNPAEPSAPPSNEVPKLKDFLEWQLRDMNEMTMDLVQYAPEVN
jgi:hypothetical protein